MSELLCNALPYNSPRNEAEGCFAGERGRATECASFCRLRQNELNEVREDELRAGAEVTNDHRQEMDSESVPTCEPAPQERISFRRSTGDGTKARAELSATGSRYVRQCACRGALSSGFRKNHQRRRLLNGQSNRDRPARGC